jgi:quercetin dioxygenase-like cupin family protein
MYKTTVSPDITADLKAVFSTLHLSALIDHLKHEGTWKKGELNSVILQKSPVKKVMLTVMHEETEVMSYQANDSITFQVLEGKLLLHIDNKSFTLKKGEVFTLGENIQYSFDSVEETALLLTLVSGSLKHPNRISAKHKI